MAICNTQPLFRTIKSFVKRQRRFTSYQQNLFLHHWQQFGVTVSDASLDWDTIFNRRAEMILEIGFGRGDALLAMTAQHPENNYLGIEVYRPGILSLMTRLAENKMRHVKIIEGDVTTVISHFVDDLFSRIHIFFPDPWPKRKHHKRRLVQSAFAAVLQKKLRYGGILHCATDWEDYARHIINIFSQTPGLRHCMSLDHDQSRCLRPTTSFEQRGLRLNHPILDVVFHKCT